MTAAALALLVGVLCLVGAFARLGFSGQPAVGHVLIGYMTGIAVLMIASQLRKISGITVSGDEFVALVTDFVRNMRSVHWPTLAPAACVLPMLLALVR